MLDESTLRRLAEMGVDAYVLRAARAVSSRAHRVSSAPARARVALVARADGAATAFLAQACRALAFARIDAAVQDAAAPHDFAGCAGLVVFGKSLARETGGALPAERAKSLRWISAAEPASIVGDAKAKRALWSELRRLIRGLDLPRDAGNA